MRIRLLLPCLSFAALAVALSAQSVTPERLAELLRRYPDADANRDGRLTEAEARAYRDRLRGETRGDATVKPATAPAPALADIRYGAHERNVLDFWSVRSRAGKPAPVVIFIHGGGFVQGDKTKAREGALLRECIDAGVAFVAINYRFLADDVTLPEILRDCARAVQFVRARAAEWNLDSSRVAVIGSSAGAGTSLWLAFHPDLADPASEDPVARESTIPTCVGASSTQFSYDFPRWAELFGNDTLQRYGGRYNSPRLYGFASREEMLSPQGQKLRADADMFGLAHAGAPPVFLQSNQPGTPPANSSEFLHHPAHAKAIHDRCRELGVRVVAVIPALGIEPAKSEPRTLRDFLFRELRVKR